MTRFNETDQFKKESKKLFKKYKTLDGDLERFKKYSLFIRRASARIS